MIISMQTPSTLFYINPSELPERPEFWLLAVGQNGTLADTKFTAESNLFDPGEYCVLRSANILFQMFNNKGRLRVFIKEGLDLSLLNMHVFFENAEGLSYGLFYTEHFFFMYLYSRLCFPLTYLYMMSILDYTDITHFENLL